MVIFGTKIATTQKVLVRFWLKFSGNVVQVSNYKLMDHFLKILFFSAFIRKRIVKILNLKVAPKSF